MRTMFVCVCKAVSDRQIRRAVLEDGVTSLRELNQLYGLGGCCGKCVPQARALLDECLAGQGCDHGVAVPASIAQAVAHS